MKINVLGIIKGVTGLVASAGAGAVVGNLVRATTPTELGRMQKVLVGVGGYTIGAVLGDLSAKYVNDQIDEFAERINDLIHPETEEQLEEKIAESAEKLTELALSGASEEDRQKEVTKSKDLLDKKKAANASDDQ